jgi:hypothetical protein
VASSCETGSCGACRVGLIGGDAEHLDIVLSEAEKRREISVRVSRSRGGMLVLLDEGGSAAKIGCGDWLALGHKRAILVR